MNPTALEKSTAVIFESVLLESDRNARPAELKSVTTDIEIFEHIDKPYVSGIIAFNDEHNIMDAYDISGAEKVTIKLRVNSEIAPIIKKVFFVDKVISSTKGAEHSEQVILHLIEEHAYASNLLNVNKAYSGSPTSIIQKISKSFIGKPILTSNSESQDIKVIVPNLTPLNAMAWIKNRASTSKGYPFYLFSALGSEELIFADLKTMIDKPSSNSEYPYMYTQTNIPKDSEVFEERTMRRTILDYSYTNTENLFDLIKKGLVGAEHQYINLTENKTHSVKFDLNKDVILTLAGDGEVSKSPLFSAEYKLNGKSFNSIQSRKHVQITGANVFEEANSYLESTSVGQYRLNSINRAMDSLLKKQPMTMTVNGMDFLLKEGNNTIGNKLSVKFLRNINDEGANMDKFDAKKSGDFLVFAAKHSFRKEAYTITFTNVKLSNGEV